MNAACPLQLSPDTGAEEIARLQAVEQDLRQRVSAEATSRVEADKREQACALELASVTAQLESVKSNLPLGAEPQLKVRGLIQH